MIEISFGKLLLLALIALMVLGPEKLPGAARTAGALLRRVRSGWDSVRTEVERELEIEEIRRAARETVAQAKSAQSQVQDAVKSVHGMAREVGNEVSREVGDMAREVKSAAEPPVPAETAAAPVAPIDEDEPQRSLRFDAAEPAAAPRRVSHGEPLTRKTKPAVAAAPAIETATDREPPHGDA